MLIDPGKIYQSKSSRHRVEVVSITQDKGRQLIVYRFIGGNFNDTYQVETINASSQLFMEPTKDKPE